MKFKSKAFVTAALASVFALANYAFAAPSLTLNIVYVGTTTANTAAATSSFTGVNTTAPLPDLSSPAVEQTATFKAIFDVYAIYNDSGLLPMQTAAFDINTTPGSGLVPVSSNNAKDSASQKWYPTVLSDTQLDDDGNPTIHNPLFGTNADSGDSAGDLQRVTLISSGVGVAYMDQFGTSSQNPATYVAGKGVKIGRFGLAFSNVLTSSATVSITETAGSSFSWYMDTSGAANEIGYSTSGISSPGFTITVNAVPEPASLGVLALGGLALLARRRKTA
jgi:hypothetical protein